DPDGKAGLTESGAPSDRGEHHIFPVTVEQSFPRPVEVDGEPQRERLEDDAVRRSAIDEAESADNLRGTVNRDRKTGRRIDDDLAALVLLVSVDRLVRLVLVGGKRVVLSAARPTPDVGEEHAADAPDDPDRSECGLDDRKPELGVGEEHVLADELEIIVSAHLRVAAEVHEVRVLAEALEPAHTRRKHARAGNAYVVPVVAIQGLTRQRRSDLRGDIVHKAHGASGQRTKLSKDGRFLDVPHAEGYDRAVAKDGLPVVLDLVLLRIRFERGVVVLLDQLHQPRRELQAAVTV